MKSYTDLEQSKKLAEILPLESADVIWVYSAFEDDYFPHFRGFGKIVAGAKDIKAWSLAALYSILPNNKKETTTLSRGGWKIEPIEYLNNWWCEYEDENHTKDFTVSADNPIDACVEMIIRLNELKML